MGRLNNINKRGFAAQPYNNNRNNKVDTNNFASRKMASKNVRQHSQWGSVIKNFDNLCYMGGQAKMGERQ